MTHKILIIDDEPSCAMVMSLLLRYAGFEVVSADSGEEGWQRLQEESSVHLIVLDMLLPDMTGLDFLKRIKASSQYRHLPVVLQTGLYGDTDQEREWHQAGAAHCIFKPYDGNEMVQKISALLQTHYKLETLSV